MIVNGFTYLGETEIGRHELSFQGVDLQGNIIPGSVLWTTELGLIPAGPLTIAPFEEVTFPPTTGSWKTPYTRKPTPTRTVREAGTSILRMMARTAPPGTSARQAAV